MLLGGADDGVVVRSGHHYSVVGVQVPGIGLVLGFRVISQYGRELDLADDRDRDWITQIIGRFRTSIAEVVIGRTSFHCHFLSPRLVIDVVHRGPHL